MENNQPQNITKKFIIKRILITLILIIAFTLPIIFIQYGGIPVKATLISFAILVVVVTTGIMFGFKYRSRISVVTFRKFFLILGILIIMVNLALVLMEGGNSNYYTGVGLGLLFIYYSRTYRKGKNSLSKNGMN